MSVAQIMQYVAIATYKSSVNQQVIYMSISDKSMLWLYAFIDGVLLSIFSLDFMVLCNYHESASQALNFKKVHSTEITSITWSLFRGQCQCLTMGRPPLSSQVH